MLKKSKLTTILCNYKQSHWRWPSVSTLTHIHDCFYFEFDYFKNGSISANPLCLLKGTQRRKNNNNNKKAITIFIICLFEPFDERFCQVDVLSVCPKNNLYDKIKE